MADDFISEFRNSFGDEEGPDWVQDLDEEEGGFGDFAELEAEPQPEPEDEFDALRQRSARVSSAYDDLSLEEEEGSGGGFSLEQFTPPQRLILALLVLLNVVVGVVAILALAGILRF